ncbi:hypothetical protein LPJ53_006215, partial [Coemansia erecta]
MSANPPSAPLALPAAPGIRKARRIVRIQLQQPAAAAVSATAAAITEPSMPSMSSPAGAAVAGRISDVARSAHNAASPLDNAVPTAATISANARAIAADDITEAGNNGAARAPAAIALPSDVIDAIADAVVGSVHLCAARQETLARMGASPELAEDAQAALRTLTHVCHAWRAALLPRAWRTALLTGAASPSARELYAFAAACVKRLVVPWGAMAAPVAWMHGSENDSDDDAASASDIEDDSDDTAIHGSIGVSVDSFSRMHLSKDAASDHRHVASASASRLRWVFGDQPWPAVEHLDMSFMPLICYQGFAAHVQHTMPRLRSLRIGGFVPATALADILQCSQLLPLESVEIAGSVWANADSGRRESASSASWRSSLSTVAPHEAAGSLSGSLADSDMGDHVSTDAPLAPPSHHLTTAHPPLARLAITADALRSPAVFAFAVAQAPTLASLHLLECDYKIVDMLRFGRLDERHMHAVEWGTTQMVLPSQQAEQVLVGNRGARRAARDRPQALQWPALRQLRIERYFMAPRENAGLRIYADSMPALEDLSIGHMEPSDSHHHPAPAAAGASQIPRLRGVFASLTHIRAPVFDIQSLPAGAPALHTLHIAGSGCALAQALAPNQRDIDALLTS